ncbi:Pyruvate kinase [Arcobacter nitrofigilis DSM 7299]|uniref:Pyruvate kinase n=1 Tax=Arcobacter nitrofigilis (strain ATCC 33309 / DSM 7299 / CCUG 15893 / LMG 7604 / NCTC 12251 / CI) TaxID=572480 RepID=D5V7G2_ARCNC|nr:pyruvate kinase [Arcobacter nitrofigilis]ADG94582.1 Pyruvate kinase [Arcobacter nitrofigilis DSM 7299]
MKKIIATVGPSLLYTTPIKEIHTEQNIYRINGAHGTIEELEKYILEIKSQIKDANILMDLPGNKVRTSGFENGYIDIKENEEFNLSFKQMNYTNFYFHLKIGDTVWANDSIFKFTVQDIDKKNEKISFLSHSTGKLLNNKGMHVRGIHENIPFLFEKDKLLIELANKHNLSYIGLSFVRTKKDIEEAQKLINKDCIIISKVETIAAVNNLVDILSIVDYILIDRGDLSTEVGLNKIPSYQKYIIDKALFYSKKVFLATQFLKSMEHNPIPTIPEVIDMYNTLKSGIYGIQMSEETAVGKYPKNCLDTISGLMEEINNERMA